MDPRHIYCTLRCLEIARRVAHQSRVCCAELIVGRLLPFTELLTPALIHNPLICAREEKCSEEFSRSVLLALFAIMLPFVSTNLLAAMATDAVVYLVISIRKVTVRKILDKWLQHGELYSTDGTTRGRVARKHDKLEKMIEVHLLKLDACILEQHKKGICVFRDLQRVLTKEVGEDGISTETITRLLKQYGYARKMGRLKIPDL